MGHDYRISDIVARADDLLAYDDAAIVAMRNQQIPTEAHASDSKPAIAPTGSDKK